MSKEEAIFFLRKMQQLLLELIAWSGNEHKINESFTMAIEALEQAEIIRCDSCRFKLWDAFSYPCVDCGRGFLHYEATNDTMPSESADSR